MNTNQLSFEQWKQEYKDLLDEMVLDDEPCEYCDGTGEDTCPCCGSDIECEHCQGTGGITREEIIKDLYKHQFEREKINLNIYLRSFANV